MSIQIVFFTTLIIFIACSVTRTINARNDSKSQNLILSLALFASTGVLLATSSIEMAGRYGYTMILALFGFSLVFVIAPLVLFPIRRLSSVVRLATSVDFLTFRYRGKNVAIVSCLATTLSIIPLVVAQILATDSLVDNIFNSSIKPITCLLLLIAVSVTVRQSLKVGIAQQLRWIMAAAGLLLIIAVSLSTWIAVTAEFGSVSQMNAWVVDSGQQTIVKRFDSSYSIFIIFLAAGISFPANFNMLVSDAISDRQASTMSWAYPLLMLLACIPIFPLLWSGLSLQSNSTFQEYLFALPLALEQPLIASLGAASIILLALALCCSLIMFSTRMILNSFVLPGKKLSEPKNLTQWIDRRYFTISLGVMLFCILLSFVAKTRSITDLYLVGFAGLAQLMPGMIAAIYLPKASRKGFIAGLSAGMFVWLVTLALPLIFGDWYWQVPLIEKPLLFGMQAWEAWSIEALMLNITLCTLFSIFSKMDEQQKNFATICMADNVYIPIRVELKQKSIAEMKQQLFLVLGQEADTEIQSALSSLKFDTNELRPGALRKIRDTINASLNMRFGVLAADSIMSQALPLPSSSGTQQEDIFLLESVLAVQGDQLTGIASELNKLRVHHREILDKLPIGVIALAQNGEILKWNAAISNYTQIDPSSASGSLVRDLPDPWKSEITSFLVSDEASRDNVRLDINGSIRWFSFQKSTQISMEEINDNIILLVEEKTQSVMLIQKSIDNERLASMGRLAAGVAHEIGNPVTGIACIAQNLEHEMEPEQISESAQHILSQTDRIKRIVDSLINFSRGETPKGRHFKRVNLKEACEEAIQLITLADHASTLSFSCLIAPNLNILGDYHQLIQVFLNLLSNSRDASPPNSAITILANSLDEKIRVTINDSGTGIAENLQSQLFEPFVTSKDPGKGTGLGLWVVFNLVKGLGAEITISSPAQNSSCGTTVALTFNKLEE
jgi:signal transduction histidine kinase/Na+/proline symporter